MRYRLVARLEALVNIAIVALVILLSAYFVKKYFFPNVRNIPPNNNIHVGVKLTMPQKDLAKNNHTLLLAIRPNCSYCSNSALFYQQLSKQVLSKKSVKFVALLPNNVNDGARYLNTLGIVVNDTIPVDFSAVGILVTPTLIWVNSAGTVEGVWFGQLPSTQESKVINLLSKSE